MTRRLLTVILILLLPLSALAEGLSPEVETPPEEVGEFDLSAPEPSPDPSPEPTAVQTPLPTLEPGSLNYPSDKVTFENEIWSILTRRWGLTDFQAAGLMSSLYLESSFSPYNAQSKEGLDDRGRYTFRTGDGVGFGLCQWTTAARKSGLRRYAIDHGDANLVWDFDIQMGYMREDINLPALQATQTLYEATEWTVMRFERPNQVYENSWPGTRYAVALQIFHTHTGKPYAEPALAFEVTGADGSAAEGAVEFDETLELTVASNYYWRLVMPDWMAMEAPSWYDPETLETRTCGYAGTTPVRLTRRSLPLVRGGELRFEIYNEAGIVKNLPIEYTGMTLPEAIADLMAFALKLARLL